MFIALLALIVALAASQDASPQLMSHQLELNTPAIVDLLPNQIATWKISLPAQLDPGEDLFITVQSPLNSPLEQPSISIKNSHQEIGRCDMANNEFAGICRVDSSNLAPSLQLYATVKCMVSCHLTLTAALQPRLRLQPQKSLLLKSPLESSAEYEFELEIPQGQQFSTLAIYAQINDFSEVKGGLEFYANIGDKDRQIPNENQHDIAGESLFWGGEGLFFSKEDFSTGKNWVKIYLSLFADMEVKLFLTFDTGNSRTLKLGQTLFDYSTGGKEKKYSLDLSEEKITGKTVAIQFITYAGTPSVKVAFDEEFKAEISKIVSVTTITYLITAELRKNPMFKGSVFISLTSEGNSDFSFHTTIHDKNFLVVSPGVSYYNELSKGQAFNYFFDDTIYVKQPATQQQDRRRYTVEIELFQGQASFGVRRCLQVESGESQSSCAISSLEEVQTNEIIAVTEKNSVNHKVLIIDYSLSQCSELKTVIADTKAYYCSFHVFAINNKENIIQYALSISKRAYSSLLKEGQQHRGSIFKGEQLYYRFGLTSLEDVQKVTFFLNVIEGDVRMLGSSTDSFPSSHTQNDLHSATSNRIVFTKNELKSHLYLTIKADSFSEYTVGVIVNRRHESDSSSLALKQSKVKLQLGGSLSYSLKENEGRVCFSISSLKDTTIDIEVIELVGDLSLLVTAEDQEQSICQPKDESSSTLLCEFFIKAGKSVDVIISGKAETEQRFVVSSYVKESCSPYSLNLPLYKSLKPGTSGCIHYSITKPSQLVLSTSVSIFHLLQGHLSLQLCIKGKCFQKVVSHHEKIDKRMLAVLCSFQEGSRKSCQIIFTFSNVSPQTIEFNSILQESELDLALFDGVAQRVSSSSLSTVNSKQFYYQVSSTSTLVIFFTSYTTSSLTILAHFVKNQDFGTNRDGSYLVYSAKGSLKSQQGFNFFSFSQKGSGSNLFAISSENIEKNCDGCVLVLSVYSDSNVPSFSAFDIEISQKETEIKIGQLKNGYLEGSDVYIYQLERPVSGDCIISVRDLGQESMSQAQCFQMSLSDNQHFTNSEVIVVGKETENWKLYITAVKPICSYQISYTYLANHITSAIQNKHYPFQIQKDHPAFFAYTHLSDEAFKVVQIIGSGEAKITISPINNKNQLKTLMESSPESFAVGGDYSQREVLVTPSSHSFCFDCTYLISVSTHKSAKGDLVIGSLESRVPLSTKGVLKQTIKVNDARIRNYSFNSAVDFNISMNILYGKVTVTVLGPDGRICSKQNVLGSVNIPIEHDHTEDKYIFELNPTSSEYIIKVQSSEDSSFTIKVTTKGLTQRIFEGITSYVSLLEQKTQILEFFNVDFQEISDVKTFNVLFEVIWKFNQIDKLPSINISVSTANKEGKITPVDVIARLDSQYSINIQLPLLSGDYFLSITSDHQVFITLLLIKESLIHLRPESNLLMTKPGTVQLYSPQKAVMMEVFTCEGNIDIQASELYEDLASDKKLSKGGALTRKDYGGHVVVSSQELKGEYYVRVNSKGEPQEQMSYLMNYYYLSNLEEVPYNLIYLSSPVISFFLTGETITFSVKPILSKNLKNSPIQDYSVEYRFYFSTSKKRIEKYSNCRLDNVVIKTALQSSQQTVQFSLEVHLILQQMEDLDAFDQIYFAGAQAVVSLSVQSNAEHYPCQLSLIYDIVEVTNQNSKGNSSHSIIIILLPVLLATIAFLCIFRFCMRRYKGMLPDDLVEEPNFKNKYDSQENKGSGKMTEDCLKNSSKNTDGAFQEDAVI